MLKVLKYLFANYIKDNMLLLPDRDELNDELYLEGFKGEEIDRAFLWIKSFCVQQQKMRKKTFVTKAIRVFTAQEIDHIGLFYCNILTAFTNNGILNAVTRELIITKLMQLKKDEITFESFFKNVLLAEQIKMEFAKR